MMRTLPVTANLTLNPFFNVLKERGFSETSYIIIHDNHTLTNGFKRIYAIAILIILMNLKK